MPVGPDHTMDYPTTIELTRFDPETREHWYLRDLDVVAHIGPGPGAGWSLDGFSYEGSRYDRLPPHPRQRTQRIRATGIYPIDAVAEAALKEHLQDAYIRNLVDEAWYFHCAERNNVIDIPEKRFPEDEVA